MKIEPRECVLLIQCNPADVRLIYKALAPTSQRFLETKSVSEVADAIERIVNGGVRAIIMDIEMPEGFARFEEVLSAAPHIPILILSGTKTECIARQAVDRCPRYILKNHMEEFRLKRMVRSMIDLKAMEEAAILQRERADAILSCTGDAVLISDVDGCVTHLNRPAEILTGWSCREAMVASSAKYFKPSTRLAGSLWAICWRRRLPTRNRCRWVRTLY